MIFNLNETNAYNDNDKHLTEYMENISEKYA